MQIQQNRPQLVLRAGCGALCICALFIAFAHLAPARVMAASLSQMSSSPAVATARSTIGFADAHYTVNEHDEAGTIILLITPPSPIPVTVTVSSTNVPTGAQASEDFIGLRQSLVIPPNQPSYTLSVQLLDDTLVEGDETLNLTLSNYQVVLPGQITETVVTIVDDDAVPTLAFAPAEANEREEVLLFVATLSVTWPHTVTVDYSTRNGTAITPDDYLPNSGVLMLPPGQTTATIAINLVSDDTDEPEENLFIDFTNPVQALLSSVAVEGIVRDAFEESLYLPALQR